MHIKFSKLKVNPHYKNFSCDSPTVELKFMKTRGYIVKMSLLNFNSHVTVGKLIMLFPRA